MVCGPGRATSPITLRSTMFDCPVSLPITWPRGTGQSHQRTVFVSICCLFEGSSPGTGVAINPGWAVGFEPSRRLDSTARPAARGPRVLLAVSTPGGRSGPRASCPVTRCADRLLLKDGAEGTSRAGETQRCARLPSVASPDIPRGLSSAGRFGARARAPGVAARGEVAASDTRREGRRGRRHRARPRGLVVDSAPRLRQGALLT